ncbi:uncharacterized protein G2W53_015791 [Senna tora]|uniref:Uncharacterized protein n=1 Tax=Senna tora TaxID=362788 RepID=A0A834WWZ4_9FABA|nr:uncharacterized protein G2W53_015791 [Senna tora]
MGYPLWLILGLGVEEDGNDQMRAVLALEKILEWALHLLGRGRERDSLKGSSLCF